MTAARFVFPLLALTLAGCNLRGGDARVAEGISLSDGVAVLTAPGQPEARISGNGDLRIGNRNISLTADQRDLLRQYYVAIYKLHAEGRAIGRSGAALAGTAVRDVAARAAAGDGGQVRPTLPSRAAALGRQGGQLCNTLDHARSRQDALSDDLPAFRPYARISADAVSTCRQGTQPGAGELASS